mgnify:CR=1 FL=1
MRYGIETNVSLEAFASNDTCLGLNGVLCASE